MPRYTYVLRVADRSNALTAIALNAVRDHFPESMVIVDPEPPKWIGECDAATHAEARGRIEARLVSLPKFVPGLVADVLSA